MKSFERLKAFFRELLASGIEVEAGSRKFLVATPEALSKLRRNERDSLVLKAVQLSQTRRKKTRAIQPKPVNLKVDLRRILQQLQAAPTGLRMQQIADLMKVPWQGLIAALRHLKRESKVRESNGFYFLPGRRPPVAKAKPVKKAVKKKVRARRAASVRGAQTCTYEDCSKPHYAKGLCNNHYNIERRRAASGIDFDPETEQSRRKAYRLTILNALRERQALRSRRGRGRLGAAGRLTAANRGSWYPGTAPTGGVSFPLPCNSSRPANVGREDRLQESSMILSLRRKLTLLTLSAVLAASPVVYAQEPNFDDLPDNARENQLVAAIRALTQRVRDLESRINAQEVKNTPSAPMRTLTAKSDAGLEKVVADAKDLRDKSQGALDGYHFADPKDARITYWKIKNNREWPTVTANLKKFRTFMDAALPRVSELSDAALATYKDLIAWGRGKFFYRTGLGMDQADVLPIDYAPAVVPLPPDPNAGQ
ncbi:MAG: hypothetical protein HY303_02045 [Candidatus Wallbacteria bacterium]|nr:hypothetical protein [Candidatus Wallbacteria bacterium]